MQITETRRARIKQINDRILLSANFSFYRKCNNNLSGVITRRCTKIAVIRCWSGPYVSACSRRIRILRFRGDAARRAGFDAVRCAAGFRYRHTDSLLYEPTKRDGVKGLYRRRLTLSDVRHGFIGDTLRARIFSTSPIRNIKRSRWGKSRARARKKRLAVDN